MRFPRQSTIFRGPLDAAPLVGVLFLLVIFLLLGSLLYTPGALVEFDHSTAPNVQTITVTADGAIWLGKTNTVEDLEKLRAGDLKNAPVDQPIRIVKGPGADPKMVEQIRELFPIRLPAAESGDMTGTDNQTVVVAVNFRGQYFFENRWVQEPELKAQLRSRLWEASRASKKLTLVLWADEAAENKVIMRLYQLGRDVGIT